MRILVLILQWALRKWYIVMSWLTEMMEWAIPELDMWHWSSLIVNKKMRGFLLSEQTLVLILQWALKMSHTIKVRTNRNVGMGDPWAGQDRLRLSDLAWVNDWESELIENFGFDPPIGSKKCFILSMKSVLTEMLEWVILELGMTDWGFQIWHGSVVSHQNLLKTLV